VADLTSDLLFVKVPQIYYYFIELQMLMNAMNIAEVNIQIIHCFSM